MPEEENIDSNMWEHIQTKIKKFAYQSFNNFHKSYKSWLTKYRERKELWDFIKIGLLFFAACTFWLLFLYYINLASTEWYFMKLANYELNSSKEKSDIVKLEVIRKKEKQPRSIISTKEFHTRKECYHFRNTWTMRKNCLINNRYSKILKRTTY